MKALLSEFWASADPTPLEAATIESKWQNHRPGVRNHVIVISDLRTVLPFVLALRGRRLPYAQHIVILTEEEPDEEDWEPLERFHNIAVLCGSGIDPGDLRRAGVRVAERVVVFAKPKLPQSMGGAASDAEGATLDADAVFTTMLVARENPSCHTIVELMTPASMSLLSHSIVNGRSATYREEADFAMSPAYAAGNAFVSSALDTLLCQAFYNPHLVEIVRLLVGEHDSAMVAEWNTHLQPEVGALQDCDLFLIPVPLALVGKQFKELYADFSLRGALPIALRRGLPKGLVCGPRGNLTPYV